MKLCGIEIVFVQGGAVGINVAGLCGCKLAHRHIEAVDEINKFAFMQAFEQRRLKVGDVVPSHGRHLVLMTLWAEPLYVGVENAYTLGVAFLRVAAQQLLPYTNAKHRLLEIADELVQETAHGRLPLSALHHL